MVSLLKEVENKDDNKVIILSSLETVPQSEPRGNRNLNLMQEKMNGSMRKEYKFKCWSREALNKHRGLPHVIRERCLSKCPHLHGTEYEVAMTFIFRAFVRASNKMLMSREKCRIKNVIEYVNAISPLPLTPHSWRKWSPERVRHPSTVGMRCRTRENLESIALTGRSLSPKT